MFTPVCFPYITLVESNKASRSSYVMIFSNITLASLNLVSKRFIRKKVTLKSWPNDWVPFHWSRPEKLPGYYDSGDLLTLGSPSKERLLPQYRNSEKLQKLDADNPLRKIFSTDHGKVLHWNKDQTEEQLKSLGVYHKVDYINSLEAKIINLTYTLRQLQDTIEAQGGETKYNSSLRLRANNAKTKRYRFLCELKEQHGDRYERLISALKIEPINNPINQKYVRPYRKKQMRLLAIDYSRDLKEKKVEDYMKSLKSDQEQFEEEKRKTMQWIEEQEKKLGFVVE